ncbi:MAG TPA: lasso RiPP family leader peptide-containing protein [Acidimicrobiales bacterium]|nr:lasso RiPP family leader peptide-containing protein [Acidimicrobiales bacterium]
MQTKRDVRNEGSTYEAPAITAHGSVADLTKAFLVGLFIDSNGKSGNLIIGSTSL